MGVGERAPGSVIRISVIIPVYNGERYLQECLESVGKCQSAEIECIIVNDGSSDATEDICKKQCARDGRFRVINKVNTGVSDSRNRGMAEASGDYIFFLDADDYIDVAVWPEILSYAEQGAYDLVAFGYVNLFESGGEKIEQFPEGCDIRLALLSTTLMNICWGKLFRRKVIIENDLAFRRGLNTCEDAVFVLDFAQYTGSYSLSNNCAVRYRIHSGGVMQRAETDAKLSDFASLYNRRCEYLSANYDAEAREAMYRQFFSVITDLFRSYSKTHQVSEIRKTCRESLRNATVASIMNETKMRYLTPVYKKLEYALMSARFCVCLSLYFKVKALYALAFK